MTSVVSVEFENDYVAVVSTNLRGGRNDPFAFESACELRYIHAWILSGKGREHVARGCMVRIYERGNLIDEVTSVPTVYDASYEKHGFAAKYWQGDCREWEYESYDSYDDAYMAFESCEERRKFMWRSLPNGNVEYVP